MAGPSSMCTTQRTSPSPLRNRDGQPDDERAEVSTETRNSANDTFVHFFTPVPAHRRLPCRFGAAINLQTATRHGCGLLLWHSSRPAKGWPRRGLAGHAAMCGCTARPRVSSSALTRPDRSFAIGAPARGGVACNDGNARLHHYWRRPWFMPIPDTVAKWRSTACWARICRCSERLCEWQTSPTRARKRGEVADVSLASSRPQPRRGPY